MLVVLMQPLVTLTTNNIFRHHLIIISNINDPISQVQQTLAALRRISELKAKGEVFKVDRPPESFALRTSKK